MNESLERKIKEIISDKLAASLERVTPSANIVNDLGADSLDEIELLMAFEDEFDIEVPDEEAAKLKTVKDVIDFIDSKV